MSLHAFLKECTAHIGLNKHIYVVYKLIKDLQQMYMNTWDHLMTVIYTTVHQHSYSKTQFIRGIDPHAPAQPVRVSDEL